MMKKFGPQYWDKYGNYRSPIGLNLSFIILLRAYVIWIFAAISRRPDLDLMSIFYQDKRDFFTALVIGSLALLPVIIYFLRRPDSRLDLGFIWRFMRWPMILACILDLSWLVKQAAAQYFVFSSTIAIQFVLVAWVLIYLIKSKYLTVFFNEWPMANNSETKKTEHK